MTTLARRIVSLEQRHRDHAIRTGAKVHARAFAALSPAEQTEAALRAYQSLMAPVRIASCNPDGLSTEHTYFRMLNGPVRGGAL